MAEQTFDYIVIGAGSAGCPVAHRLSAKADIQVLNGIARLARDLKS
jgi:choline dehydrogenase